ncbi:MAG: 5-(carboxyamino)imidazole ribonucleotide synthase [Clostridia bacterium]
MSYKIGIIGGGQLAMMLIEECKKRGIQTASLDETADAPALKIADTAIVGKFSDECKIEQLCKECDVVTYEFENIDCAAVEDLSKKYNIMQGARPLFYSKNRVTEKTFAEENGLTPPKFMAVNSFLSLTKAIEYVKLPAVLKTCTMGYDGKGQYVIRTAKDIKKIPQILYEDSILEEFIPFDYETSCIVIRNKNDEIVHLPLGQNIHKNGILDMCVVPSKKISAEMELKIVNASEEFMRKADFYGIVAIEYFVKGNDFFFNEMAPRPHNSGHYSIEGCDVSQYGCLVDCLCGEHLRQPKLLQPTFMKNILGQDVDNLKKLKIDESTFVHDYHKSEKRVNRKMGHVTFTKMTEEEFFKMNENVFGGHNE